MRAVVQRVTRASVSVEGQIVASIGDGLLVFLGVGRGDSDVDVEYLARKIASLRVFRDDLKKMNLSLKDRGGSVLLVSQFTLYGDLRQGTRPSFEAAEDPARALLLYQAVAARLTATGVQVCEGVFRADMQVDSCNDGPVTILLDSRKLF